HGMGSEVLYRRCVIWPLAANGAPAGILIGTALVAFPLARDVARARRRATTLGGAAGGAARGQRGQRGQRTEGTFDVRWSGRSISRRSARRTYFSSSGLPPMESIDISSAGVMTCAAWQTTGMVTLWRRVPST